MTYLLAWLKPLSVGAQWRHQLGDETATKPATKKRNEDFLKELDKDRTEKACEYAVLVSLITLLRNAALNAMKYKSELALVRSLGAIGA